MTRELPPALARKYAVHGAIAAGGFGVMLRATQRALQRPVALKLLLADHLENDEQVARFIREAQVTAALDNPAIVRVLDHGVDAGVPWIAYELLPGPSLRARLDEGPLDWKAAAAAGAAIARALAAAHDAGVLHRDVKPDNVLADEHGQWKLVDFGIARWARDGVRTATGIILGTPAYLSPEQCLGDEPTPASDVYALGCTLYELVTGKPPHEAANALAVLRKHIDEDAAPLAQVPPEFARAIASALARDPKKRPVSAQAFARELEALVRGEPPRRTRPSSQAPKTRVAGARALVPALAAVAALALLALSLRPVSPPPPPAASAGRSPSPPASPEWVELVVRSRTLDSRNRMPSGTSGFDERPTLEGVERLATIQPGAEPWISMPPALRHDVLWLMGRTLARFERRVDANLADPAHHADAAALGRLLRPTLDLGDLPDLPLTTLLEVRHGVMRYRNGLKALTDRGAQTFLDFLGPPRTGLLWDQIYTEAMRTDDSKLVARRARAALRQLADARPRVADERDEAAWLTMRMLMVARLLKSEANEETRLHAQSLKRDIEQGPLTDAVRRQLLNKIDLTNTYWREALHPH